MRLSGAKAFKDLFGDVRSIEVSIIIILFSISLTLITDGIEELIKNTFNIYFFSNNCRIYWSFIHFFISKGRFKKVRSNIS